MGEKKIEQKVSSNGRIVIPKKWRGKMDLKDGAILELEFEREYYKA